jgi:hypothetical protein
VKATFSVKFRLGLEKNEKKGRCETKNQGQMLKKLASKAPEAKKNCAFLFCSKVLFSKYFLVPTPLFLSKIKQTMHIKPINTENLEHWWDSNPDVLLHRQL